MNIYVEFSNKDLVKKLGCKWDQEKKSWQCHHTNSDENIKKLIQHQKNGEICFINHFVPKYTVDKHSESFKNQNLFDIGYQNISYIMYHDEETILNIIKSSRQQEKRNKELTKNCKVKVVDEFIDDVKENVIKEDDKITTLKQERQVKFNEMIKRHEEELKKLEEYYIEEETHLNNCKFRDYDQDIRSWSN